MFAVATNILTFWVWGLEYAHFASPTDILRSSIVFCVAAIPIVLGSLAAFYLGTKVPTVKKALSQNIAMLLITILFAISFFVNATTIFSLTNSSDRLYIVRVINITLLSINLFQFAVFKGKRYVMYRALLFVQCLVLLIYVISSNALYAAPTIEKENSICGSPEYVLWLGSDWAVTTCDEAPYNSRKTYHVVKSENLAFKSVPETGRD